MDKEETPLKQIRTYQGDVADALKKQRESLFSIQQREQAKKTGSTRPTISPDRKRQLISLSIWSLVLMGLGTLGGWYAYNEFVRKTTTPPLEVPANRFIFAGAEAEITLSENSRQSLIKELTDAARGTTRGEVKHIVVKSPEGMLLTTKELLETLETTAPGYLVRAFAPLFMYGALGENNFLIIKLDSFENAFAGMLAWEKTLSREIGPLFSTASLIQNMGPEESFSDLTDKNKDIRVLSVGGNRVLLYTFFESDVLIITESLEATRILVDRLTQEKLSR